MKTENWYYYNRAMLPKKAPHEEADTSVITDGTIWKNPKKPLLARWTTDFDCGYETEWWFCIRDGKISLDDMKSKKRKKIISGLENVEVRQLDTLEYIDEIYEVYTRAFSKYEFSKELSKEKFFEKEMLDKSSNIECWGAFLKTNGKLVAYRKCIKFDKCVDFSESKYHPDFLGLRIAEALTYVMLDYYLNTLDLDYVFSGERTINHVTSMQSFYEEHFSFRKAYCNLNIAYRPIMKAAVKVLRIFKKPIEKIGKKVNIFHSIDAIIKMDIIARKCKKVKGRNI